jgi:hypothetical protein
MMLHSGGRGVANNCTSILTVDTKRYLSHHAYHTVHIEDMLTPHVYSLSLSGEAKQV